MSILTIVYDHAKLNIYSRTEWFENSSIQQTIIENCRKKKY